MQIRNRKDELTKQGETNYELNPKVIKEEVICENLMV